MSATKATKSHLHARWSTVDTKTGEKTENKKTYNLQSFSIDSLLDEFKNKYSFIEYQQHYAKYKNEGVEYVRFEATIEGGYQLTVDLFSCYCEPLNVNQDPPF